jgi:class 3 adenylate cyclase
MKLGRWGLTFDDPEIERAYRLWHREKAVPFTRIGMIASLAAWISGAGIFQLAAPELVGRFVVFTWPIILPVVLVALWISYRPRLIAWLLPTTALAGFVAGMLVVLGFFVFDLGTPGSTLGPALIAAEFGMVVFRLRPLYALLTVTPYLVTFQVLLITRSHVNATEKGFFSGVIWLALGLGMIACAAIDRVSRESFRQERINEEQARTIAHERERADRLLYSIFPAPIAERLKTAPEVIAERFDEVTVLFADVVGFTPLAASLSAERLVEILNEIFTRFDELAAHHGVEKVKTIGDAYMAVAGLPERRTDHATAAAELAVAMRAAVGDLAERIGHPIQIRIGLCSGPVVAGVIGARKFAYDLWGDTVNTAARMESTGVGGEIQVAEATYLALKDRFALTARGTIEVKGKGAMRTWFLLSQAALESARGA